MMAFLTVTEEKLEIFDRSCSITREFHIMKIIPTQQEGGEGNRLLVVGEERAGGPSSESLQELIQERSMLRKEQGLVVPGFGLDAQTYIHSRIDMFPCARNMCKAAGYHPELIQIPCLEMNRTTASWLVGAKSPASGACASQECRRTASRSNHSNTYAQASLKPVTPPDRHRDTRSIFSHHKTTNSTTNCARLSRTLNPNPTKTAHNTTQGMDHGLPSLLAMGTLVVFDFDWSLIDCNSDTWVVDKLGAMERMKSLRDSLPWTQLMDRMMTELHDSGRTLEDIDRSLRMCPVEQEMVTSVKFAAELGFDLQIVSDANSHFIKVILERHGLQQYFSEVHTNPAHVAESGALRVLPFHPEEKPHGCKLCPPNMCKGLILDSMRMGTSRRIIYIGDGGGDYCPSLRLGDGDHVLARHGFPLSKRLESNIDSVNATVHDWSTAKDVERLFRVLLT